MRFPEVGLILRKKGAQILTYPSAFAYTTGQAHWEILLRARAIENQCYVIASAQIGYHNDKRRSFGRGMIVDPWGKILAECQENSELDVAIAEIDLDKIEKIKLNMPCFNHRRHDIYSLTPLEYKNEIPKKQIEKFMFSKFEIPNETIFYESDKSLAFTNIRCVVPGRILFS